MVMKNLSEVQDAIGAWVATLPDYHDRVGAFQFGTAALFDF
jgi:hypothetical protein